ncbi:Electron transport complex protein RnfB [uncultured Gammaproteobacteria bacterium]|jgi:electron transport complex protein RnfB|uniref:Ion-translocating oxidoreductase complex subunit B n=3 Tax=sulfur-oxidizing symbionts TaxID=32036 RepID=A0A1H6KN65_9GAMM|nr:MULTISPECIES: electron transport complex subunit RsxB [Gammaproteobacteria]CAC9478727.1 Electron transport complex protein RnfB [uncultured Gammaproteobacteria bacterium]CAB5507122.1 Electron transport complex protein RnfB [Bathymodiolus azoricus thioautotrophic gill symbiont]CAB5507883.1 Electron transport complex protein RnfB [Bathymodiolus thermophilus thioautotrophic gill symbiont]CAC9485550.1 Electron transport complex protein RnfB [uncultured Gammaproteobacteria bacterium]CAC9485836.1
MFDAIIIFSVLSLILGLILGYAAIKFKIDGNPLVDQIDALLPQTQCGQCDFAGCRPYAEAIAKGEAQINQCPPGGQDGVDALAELLDVETLLLNEEFGENTTDHVVYVDEQVCIGCTLCIQACPVDAFVGASKVMTTVIEDECTGCDLCIPVCPVDCIHIKALETTLGNYVPDLKEIAHG